MKAILFLALFALCLVVANRDTSMFADAENYYEYFSAAASGNEINAEPSFILIAKFVDSVDLDLNALFLIYALLGVFLKGAFFILKMPKHLHISLLYFTGYFVTHDLVQIRIGAALGLALWAVFLLGEKKPWASALLWVLAFALHFSTLLLAFVSIFLYFTEKVGSTLFNARRIALMNLVLATLLLLASILSDASFSSLVVSTFSEVTLIPERYSENYFVSDEVIGFSKISYSFSLAIVAFYTLHHRMLVGFAYRHAAVSLTFAVLLLVAMKDLPVIGARLADTFLFFAPLMVLGVYQKHRLFGEFLFVSILIAQLINLFFFSTVIYQ